MIIRVLIESDGDYCQCCKKALPAAQYQLDHIDPFTQEANSRRRSSVWRGKDYLDQLKNDNLQLLCIACNVSKGRTVKDFRTTLASCPDPF